MSATADDFVNFTRSPADYGAAVTNKTVPSAPSRDFDYYIWVYMSPFVFLPGVVGNVLTAVVMRRPAFRRTTTAIYLPLIAIADTVVLVSGLLPEWLEWIDVVVLKEISIWTCRAHKFVFFTAGDVSIWLIIAFTFDRFIAVCFPLSKRTVCAPKRAIIASVVILLLFCTKNAHEFWTRGYVPSVNESATVKTICGIPQPYIEFHAYIRPWIAFTMITALPFALILIFNVLIVHSLVRAQRMRALHAAAGHGGNSAGGSSASAASGFRQTTLMCLSVSFAFLACILPSIILLIGKPHWSVSPPATAATRLAYKRAKAINNMLVYVNHSINFILYCLTGRRFRDELAATFQTAKKPGAAGTKTSGLISTTNTNGNGNKRRLGPEVSDTSKGTRVTLATDVEKSEMAVKRANSELDADSFVD